MEWDTVIDRYSREQAIDDGMLVDVSNEPETKEAGFTIPVCLTASVYNYVEVPEKLEGSGQSFKGRLWDTVYMATMAFRAKKATLLEPDNDSMKITEFKVSYHMGDSMVPVEAKLWLVFDSHEGFTIMLPSDY